MSVLIVKQKQKLSYGMVNVHLFMSDSPKAIAEYISGLIQGVVFDVTRKDSLKQSDLQVNDIFIAEGYGHLLQIFRPLDNSMVF